MLININQLDSAGLTLFVQQASSGAAFSGNAVNYLTNSGFIGPLAVWTSGGAQTVRGAKTFTSAIGVPYTGATGETVARLYVDQSVLAASGAVNTSVIGASGVLSSIQVTGSAIIPHINLTGLGGTIVLWSGGQVFISGAAGGAGGGATIQVTGSSALSSINLTGGGTTTISYDGTYVTISSAGGGAPNAVFQTGNQTISGLKIFTGSVLVAAPTAPSGAVNLLTLTGASGALYTQITGMTGYNVINTFYITGTGTINNTFSATGNIYNTFNVSGNVTNGGTTINLGAVTGNFVNISFFFEAYNLITGLNQIESFVARDFTFTGYAVGAVNSGTQGFMSGSLYQRTPLGTKVPFRAFSFNSGQFFTGVGGLSQTLSGMNRVGVDILILGTGMTGVTVGLFGLGF